MTVSKNNIWASHGLDRFCVRPYSKLGPEFQVMTNMTWEREPAFSVGVITNTSC